MASRRITIGIRSWMWPAASVAWVVITEQVRSHAVVVVAVLGRIAPDLVDAGHHQQAAVGAVDEERLLLRLALATSDGGRLACSGRTTRRSRRQAACSGGR